MFLDREHRRSGLFDAAKKHPSREGVLVGALSVKELGTSFLRPPSELEPAKEDDTLFLSPFPFLPPLAFPINMRTYATTYFRLPAAVR